MADYRLSSCAQADLAGIADYTIETFGLRQARRYRDELETCFCNLAENPRLGRLAERLAPEGQRADQERHRAEHAEHLLSEERRRAERLAALLRRSGIDPERG